MYKRHQFEDKIIHVIEFLHDDGVKSRIRLTPFPDGGLGVHVDLGEGKTLHDLTIDRPTDHEDNIDREWWGDE